MKFMVFLVATMVSAGIFPRAGLSQNPNPPEPSREPAVAGRPAIGKYTITFTFRTPLPEWSAERLAEIPKRYHPRRRSRVEGASDGKIRREIRTWSDGVVTEGWALQGITLFQNPSLLPEDIQIFESGGPMMEGDDVSKTFPELAWVSEANYRQRASYKGQPVDHYFATSSASMSGGIGETAVPAIETEAWIDPKTRLPVAARRGAEIREYSFTLERPGALTPPRLFLEFLEGLRKLRDKPPGSL